MLTDSALKNEEKLPELRRNYPLFRFVGGNVISFFGDQIYLIALPLIVLAITGSPLSMGMISALERLPIVLQPITGILSDRLNRKWLLMICDMGRCLIIGLLGVLFILEHLHLWELTMAALLIGVMSQIYNTSQFASVPHLVRRNDLQFANSINAGLSNTAVLLGPTLGGLIISLYNPGYALLVNSFSFFISFLSISSVALTPRGKIPSKQSFVKEIKEGFQFVLQKKPILFTNLAILTSMFGTTFFLTLMIFHLKESVHLSANQIGWLVSIGGIGSISGSICTYFLIKQMSYRTLLFLSSVLGGISLLFFSDCHTYIGLIVYNAMGTFMASIMNPCIVTIRQLLTPDHLLGRVQATSRFMAWVLLPLSAFLAGVLAQAIGTHLTIFIGGIFTTLSSVFYLHPSLNHVTKKGEKV
ncbi:MFS family permease [Pullulanibacillus pueri]|uniref:MFS transporter n=1 Tax=Pullulanibacillus pueri TaxID=1437324 RepID=A0A8J3ELP7_9BACL|nr:MFS transporter [Pullulanibacillus pueri]MBM7681155.1 MFS family permease [Pullulanibacillus pueri]GGH77261.1 MFS transporter [Pullulanibacillus pueri]